MNIDFRLIRQVVVCHMRHTDDIYATRSYVCRNQDTATPGVKIPKGCCARKLRLVSMNSAGLYVASVQMLNQTVGALLRTGKTSARSTSGDSRTSERSSLFLLSSTKITLSSAFSTVEAGGSTPLPKVNTNFNEK